MTAFSEISRLGMELLQDPVQVLGHPLGPARFRLVEHAG